MNKSFDFVVIGSGFGGAIISMVLRKLGHSVLLVERSHHPRFAIGESSTPFANLLLERLAEEYDLPFLRSLSEWGSWQRDFPHIACGLKRGFTFYHHSRGRPVDFADRDAQLLVAASPNNRVADTHWYRPDLDTFLVKKARQLGVAYLDETTIESAENAAHWTFRLRRKQEVLEIQAGFAIDASGAAGFLADHLGVGSRSFPGLPATTALYAHFRNVPRLSELADLERELPPYPPDDAAVHHMFNEGWIWVLRFNNGITSAGAALRDDNPVEDWPALLSRFPTLQRQFEHAEPVTPFYRIPRLSFRRTRAAGANWALLPATVGFVDPLISTGFALNLLGISRLARLLALTDTEFSLGDYETQTFAELDATGELIGAMYSKLSSFPEFAALSLLYFAAMSFTETAWRLGKQHRASGFLLANDPAFSDLRRSLCQRALSGGRIDRNAVFQAIAPWDIAGLSDGSRHNFYPVILEDLIRGRAKLDATEADLHLLFSKLGLVSPHNFLAESSAAAEPQ